MKKPGFWEGFCWLIFVVALGFGILSQLTVRKRVPAFLEEASEKVDQYLQREYRAFERWQLRVAASDPQNFDDWHVLEPLGSSGMLYVSKDDSLVYWNSNRLTLADRAALQAGFVMLDNLIAYAYVATWQGYTFSWLVPLRDNYIFENRYLKNQHYLRFDAIEQIKLLPPQSHGQLVRDGSGKEALRVSVAGNQRYVNLLSREWQSGISFLMAIAAAMLLFFFRIDRKMVLKRPWYSLAEFTLPVLVIRILLFNYRSELGLTAIELFDPKIFASHWLLPSFGDLLLHFLFIGVLLLYLFRYKNEYHLAAIATVEQWRRPLPLFAATIFVTLFFLVSLLISRDLVFSSDMAIGLQELFEFNSYTYLAYFAYLLLICTNASAFYLIFKYLWLKLKAWKLLVLYACVMLFIAWLFSFTGEQVWLRNYFGWWIALGAIIWLLRVLNLQFQRLFYVLVALWSLFVGFQLSEALHRKQIEKARYTARKIFAPSDATAVYLLLDMIPALQQDISVAGVMTENTGTARLQNRIVYEYLKGYLEKYMLLDFEILKGQPLDDYRQEDLRDELLSLDRFGMLRQFKQNARQGYSLRIPVAMASGSVDTLLLRMVQKSLKPESPFPSLLLEGDVVQRDAFSSFSFAVYESNQLIQQGGKYPYQLFDDNWRSSPVEFNLEQSDGLSHFIYRPDEANTVVVSFASGGWVQPLSAASGLFILCLVFLFSSARLSETGPSWQRFAQLTYRNRIEIALIGSVFAIMLVIGYATVTYVVVRSKANSEELITARLQDLQSAVEDNLRLRAGQLPNINNQRVELNQIAATKEADFSIYDLTGKLQFSSQARLFERKLLGENAHPDAFYQVARQQRTVFLQNETIGRFNYQSAYLPLRDNRSQLVGILNMPSFDAEAIDRAELNEFVGNLLSIYLIMLLVAGVLVFWLAARITGPLQLLIQVIQQTKAGQRNQPTAWKRNDEIGQLLNSYNDMVTELDQSALLLAQSERESAWREMARQIAHEIRNPLTPMKLKLQRLLRDFNENPDRFNVRFKSETGLVLEQIDVLAAVAGEFSSFAQVQVGEKIVFDLRQNLLSVIALYEQQGKVRFRDDTPQYGPTTSLDDQSREACWVNADALQVQRVFQNLVKNAFQSVPEQREPDIRVRLYRHEQYWAVDVTDNGTGISAENQEKIFQPNFTTKTSGMGLGLAIVKKIIEQNEGIIGFDTTEGVGSRFYVWFPSSRHDA
jgi:two-component system nitrogen regulation sensor histidine kinase NtrY